MSWRMEQVCERTLTLHPAEIVGKGRPRMDTRYRRTYTPAKTVRAEAEIRQAWMLEHGDDMAGFDGPVAVRVAYARPLARSNPNYWAGRADIGRVDCDNVLKLVLDAINGLAFRDDRQVVSAWVGRGARLPHGEACVMQVTVTYYKEERA